MTDKLHLRAEEPDDLIMLSACVQDMAVRATDVCWLPAEQRLVLVGNRFRWEHAALGPKHGGVTRVRSALRFDFVQKAKRRHWPAGDDAVLALLAVTFTDDEGLLLSFADDVAVAIDVEVLDATLEDLSDPWATGSIPDHDAP